MNILIFAHDCGLRGAEKVAADQAEALTRRGWKATVVVPCRTGGLTEVLRGRGIDCVHVRYCHWFGTGRLRGRAYRTLSNIVAIPRMLRIVRSVQPDVILVHSIACGVGAIAARLSGTPRIWQFHETGPYGTSSDRGYFDLGERLSVRAIRWADCRLLAVSYKIADLYERKLGVAQVRVLYQAVDMNDAHPASDSVALARLSSWPGPKLMIVGSLSPLKDQSTAVRAMPRILEAQPDAGLFLVGDDPVGTGAEIAALARDLGIADKVVHLGTLANAAAAIARAECCIVTSFDEGFGRVTIEAMLSETPVAVADVEVNREVAGKGNADFFAPSDPLSLAAAVNKVFARTEQSRRERLARAKSFARQKFSSTAATDALEAELLACLDRAAPENTGMETS